MVGRAPYLFHSVLSPLMNVGLLDPRDVVDRVLAYARSDDVSIASVEGFVRQVIGWREYMRATYLLRAPDAHAERPGADALDRRLRGGTADRPRPGRHRDRTDRPAGAHHIERLMVLGNAMLLLRFDPDEVYAWFMTMFVDAYDWVMVPNVYAMSQFAAGDLDHDEAVRQRVGLPAPDERLRAGTGARSGTPCTGSSSRLPRRVRAQPRRTSSPRTYDRLDAATKAAAHPQRRALVPRRDATPALLRARPPPVGVERSAQSATPLGNLSAALRAGLYRRLMTTNEFVPGDSRRRRRWCRTLPPRAARSAAQRVRPRRLDVEHRAHPCHPGLSRWQLAAAGWLHAGAEPQRPRPPRRGLRAAQGLHLHRARPGRRHVIGCVYLYPTKDDESDVVAQSWVTADRAELEHHSRTPSRAGSRPTGRGSAGPLRPLSPA